MMVHRWVSFAIAVVCAATLGTCASYSIVAAQSAGNTGATAEAGRSTLRGFSQSQAVIERSWEARFNAIPSPALLREYMKILSAEPHHVGSPADKQNAEFILGKFRSWGLQANIEEFQVLFPTPKERVLELVAPEPHRAELREPALVQDQDSSDANQLPTYNAYSADGDVTAQLVYVNYGIPADYEELAKMGVDVTGKVVIARYGASWRGIKPKVAYEHGAMGCLIYSDPKDDGYYVGDVYPDGPYRPSQGVQRGSVADMPVYPGDPLTPGWGAVKGAKRLAREEAKTLVKIPVLPISYGDALPLLRNLRGPVAPESWRGALPITYHVGPGAATVHLKVSFNWNIEPIYDVIARIEGTTFPDQWVIRGNHHDGWVNGATDPTSGMVVLMEEARACAELLKQGWKPLRTIIFAAWDGEEPGLLGSTEWAEQHGAELAEKAIVYINTDSNGKGTLGVSGSHSLERFINNVARDVADPRTAKPLEELMRQSQLRSLPEQEKKEAESRPDVRIGALGSGSDYSAFLDHLGIASMNLGFGGEDGGGVYHSIYDSFAWYTRFSDTNFEYGRTLALVNGAAVLRLANAPLLQFEFTNLAETVGRYVNEIDKLQEPNAAGQRVDLSFLRSGVDALKQSAARFEAAYQKASASGKAFDSDPPALAKINKLLYRIERSLLSPAGLPRRDWYKHQLYAPGAYTGYGVKTIPAVREALEQKLFEEGRKQVPVVGDVLSNAAKQIDAAAQLLSEK